MAARIVVGLSGVATAVLTTWMTVIAFVGGTMPIVGWQTEGGITTGLLWLLVVDPIVASVCWMLTTAVLLPIVSLGGDDR